jgi:hypothetical protein
VYGDIETTISELEVLKYKNQSKIENRFQGSIILIKIGAQCFNTVSPALTPSIPIINQIEYKYIPK